MVARWLPRRPSQTQTPAAPPEAPLGFLPDFCAGEAVINVVLIAQMLAFVVTLLTRRIFQSVFVDLAMISLLVQWIALTSVALLCVSRASLNRLSPLRAVIAAYVMLLAATVIVGEAGLWIAALVGLIPTAHPDWYSYYHVQNLTVSAIVNALALRYFFVKHEIKQRTASEARAKLAALQSRIRPHFLFNSMNVVASLIRTAPAKAEAAIEDVADLFRMMLAEEESLVPVKHEIEVAKKYLHLEGLRLDNRLRLEWDVGKFPRRAVMPVLTLQAVLENAIHYAAELATTGNLIKLKLVEDNDVLTVSVSAAIPQNITKAQVVDDASLDNLRQRLESHYGDRAQLNVVHDDGRYEVMLSLPARGAKP